MTLVLLGLMAPSVSWSNRGSHSEHMDCEATPFPFCLVTTVVEGVGTVTTGLLDIVTHIYYPTDTIRLGIGQGMSVADDHFGSGDEIEVPNYDANRELTLGSGYGRGVPVNKCNRDRGMGTNRTNALCVDMSGNTDDGALQQQQAN